MHNDIFETTPPLMVEKLSLPVFRVKGLRVSLIRTDQIHPQISGNKWFKLKYNLQYALQNNYKSVVSFGGAYSNHLHALAWAAKESGLVSIGVVRGEVVSNPMLEDAIEWGMRLHFVDRENYRRKNDPEWLSQHQTLWGDALIVPEGGSNALAVKGVAELARSIELACPDMNYLLSPCGTGGTLAGLISGVTPRVKVEGYPVLKGGSFLTSDIASLLQAAQVEPKCEWRLDLNAHYGGYGKANAEHLAFLTDIEERLGIPLDQVYTSKMLRRFLENVEQNRYPVGSHIVLVHTGGLQGRRSLR